MLILVYDYTCAVKRKLAYDIKNLINRKYNMDDLFERTILDMDKE